MAMSRFNLKMIEGIERPAIAALWPTLRGESVVLDVGASIGADARIWSIWRSWAAPWRGCCSISNALR
jgi:fatty acid/phospholipid biosynthesis enzyme